jgi:hypothetical protein
MRNFIAGITATSATIVLAAAIVWFVVPPRLDWGAGQPPVELEQELARNILRRWELLVLE